MDLEERKMLEEALELGRENNQILHAMRRSIRWSRFMSFVYWAFIIGSAVGAYYFIEPYIKPIMDVYSGASEVFKTTPR